jgi:membrane protease YdiL (CAAX protease family)
MILKKAELTGSWGFKLSVGLLAGYVLVCIPTVFILFRGVPWIINLGPGIIFLAILTGFVVVKKIPLSAIGFTSQNLKQNVVLGLGVGGLLILSLPLLDGLIDLSGLGQNELFAGAEKRSVVVDPVIVLFSVLIIPIVEQAFFSGLVLQGFLKKFKPVIAIYLVGILYPLALFELDLGNFLIGLGTACLFYFTGALWSSIIFQSACHAAGFLLMTTYPRLSTLLVFLQ